MFGEPIDKLGPVDAHTTYLIHRYAPTFIQLNTKLSIFEIGIKVVDLLAPYRRGGKIGPFILLSRNSLLHVLPFSPFA